MSTSSTEEKVMKLKLPAGKFGAYLFDCDGTIADSMPLHYLAWKQALGKWNCAFDEQTFYAWGGMPTSEIIATLNKMQGLTMAVEAVCTEKENLYYEMLPQLKAIAEVVEHIEAQHGRIPFAVVSGSRRNSVVGSLTALGLLDKFDVLVCAEDYKNGKPAPDGLLKILAGRDPSTAVYVGDNIDDALAARDAKVPFMAILPKGAHGYRERLSNFRRLGAIGILNRANELNAWLDK